MADRCPCLRPDFAHTVGLTLPLPQASFCHHPGHLFASLPYGKQMPFAMAKSCPNNLADQFIPISMQTAMQRQMYSSWQKLSFAMTILAPPHNGHDLPLYKTGKKLPAPGENIAALQKIHCRINCSTNCRLLPHLPPVLCHIATPSLPQFCRYFAALSQRL